MRRFWLTNSLIFLKWIEKDEDFSEDMLSIFSNALKQILKMQQQLTILLEKPYI